MSDQSPFEENKSSSEELPRRGYQGVPRPMAPPPPPPSRYPPPNPKTAPPPPTPQRPATQAPPPPPARSSPENQFSRRDNGLYFPCWSLIVLITIVAIGALGLFYLAVNSEGFVPGDQSPQIVRVSATPDNVALTNPTLFIVVTPIPLNTSIPAPATAFPILSTSVPQAIPSATALPGVTIGCPKDTEVRIVGVGTTGLSIRSEPIQGDNILRIAREGDRLKIVDGPQFSTGVSGQIEYCRVQGIDDASIDGWAAREYLADIEQFNE